jgi:hypothetical protein
MIVCIAKTPSFTTGRISPTMTIIRVITNRFFGRWFPTNFHLVRARIVNVIRWRNLQISRAVRSITTILNKRIILIMNGKFSWIRLYTNNSVTNFVIGGEVKLTCRSITSKVKVFEVSTIGPGTKRIRDRVCTTRLTSSWSCFCECVNKRNLHN